MRYAVWTLFLISQLAYGQFNKDHFDFNDRYAYDFVKSTCHLNLNALADIVEVTKKDSLEYLYYLNPSNINPIFLSNNIISRKGIGRTTDRLLKSTGYYIGLRECFPDSELSRNVYTANLLLFDAFGKFASICIVGGGGGLVYKGAAFVGTRLATPIVVYGAKRLSVSEEFIKRLPAYLSRMGFWGTNAVILGIVADQVREIKKNRDLFLVNPEATREQLELARKSLKENLDLYYYIQNLKQNATDANEIKQVDELLEQEKQNVQFYADNLLASPDISTEEKAKIKEIKL